jgi:hypothetical protein
MENEPLQISLISSQGIRHHLYRGKSNQLSLDVSAFSAGFYWLEAQTSDNHFSSPLILLPFFMITMIMVPLLVLLTLCLALNQRTKIFYSLIISMRIRALLRGDFSCVFLKVVWLVLLLRPILCV